MPVWHCTSTQGTQTTQLAHCCESFALCHAWRNGQLFELDVPRNNPEGERKKGKRDKDENETASEEEKEG